MTGSQNIKPAKGLLLLSAPFLEDIFKRSVILLTEHNEEGSVGFIINKQSAYKLNDIVEDFPDFDAPIYIGGPVQQDSLNFIHCSPQLQGGHEIGDGYYWGGDFESLKYLAGSGMIEPEDFRFILGYAGWGPGQLESELEKDSWFLSGTDKGFVFDQSAGDLWSRALRKLGSKYAVISTFPDDPSVN